MAFATRLTPAMAARWRGAGLWSDETFATVLARWVGATPDREALTDGTRRLTYRELADGIDRMAARLRALGIGAGDVHEDLRRAPGCAAGHSSLKSTRSAPSFTRSPLSTPIQATLPTTLDATWILCAAMT